MKVVSDDGSEPRRSTTRGGVDRCPFGVCEGHDMSELTECSAEMAPNLGSLHTCGTGVEFTFPFSAIDTRNQ